MQGPLPPDCYVTRLKEIQWNGSWLKSWQCKGTYILCSVPAVQRDLQVLLNNYWQVLHPSSVPHLCQRGVNTASVCSGIKMAPRRLLWASWLCEHRPHRTAQVWRAANGSFVVSPPQLSPFWVQLRTCLSPQVLSHDPCVISMEVCMPVRGSWVWLLGFASWFAIILMTARTNLVCSTGIMSAGWYCSRSFTSVCPHPFSKSAFVLGVGLE